MMKNPEDVNQYIISFPEEVQKMLQELRSVIKKTAPEAAEGIGYGMPSYKLNGVLVYFAGYKKHIGFYPMPSVLQQFKEELSEYKSSKGAVQFPLDRPLPVDLIARMVKVRVEQNLEKAYSKKKK